jgi:hypothetical protein
MKNKTKYYTVGTVSKFSRKREVKSIPLTHKHMMTASVLGLVKLG